MASFQKRPEECEVPAPSLQGWLSRLLFTNVVAWTPQIFNLMKFDSYTRFLKSPLYQECILAEVEGRSLPDAQQVPSSPASKHSVSSDHSSVSTPKKVLLSCACRGRVQGGSCSRGGSGREAVPGGFLHTWRMQGTSWDAAC